MKVILIVIMHSYYSFYAVSMQEFDSMTQCQYAKNLIAQSGKHLRIECINKG